MPRCTAVVCGLLPSSSFFCRAISLVRSRAVSSTSEHRKEKQSQITIHHPRL